MKVNTPPPTVPDSAAPGAAGPENQPDPAPEQDADLFRQAMAGTAPPANRTGGNRTGAHGTDVKHHLAEGDIDAMPGQTGAGPGDDTALARDAGRLRQAVTPGVSRAVSDSAPVPDRAGADGSGAHTEDGPATAPGSKRQPGPVNPDRPGAASPRMSDDGAGAGATAPGGLPDTDDKGPESGPEAQQDLQQLVAEQMMRSQTASMQRAEASAPDAISPQLVSDVAQRILVSAGNDGADREVRIRIKDTLLQDTDVIIGRRHGDLQVTFITQSPSDNVLLNRSRDAISSSLEQALDGAVKVNVETDTDTHDGRSRGEYIREEDV